MYIVYFILLINSAATLGLILFLKRTYNDHGIRFKSLEDNHTVLASKAAATCDHCERLIGRYFIDGAGRTVCKKCKPEGYADAAKKGLVRG